MLYLIIAAIALLILMLALIIAMFAKLNAMTYRLERMDETVGRAYGHILKTQEMLDRLYDREEVAIDRMGEVLQKQGWMQRDIRELKAQAGVPDSRLALLK